MSRRRPTNRRGMVGALTSRIPPPSQVHGRCVSYWTWGSPITRGSRTSRPNNAELPDRGPKARKPRGRKKSAANQGLGHEGTKRDPAAAIRIATAGLCRSAAPKRSYVCCVHGSSLIQSPGFTDHLLSPGPLPVPTLKPSGADQALFPSPAVASDNTPAGGNARQCRRQEADQPGIALARL